jgi:luciferase family oxidoreductase group 1
MHALRRNLAGNHDAFPQDVQELIAYLGPLSQGQLVRAIPGGGSQVPVWILGSSLYGAQLAAMLGLPYAFASHFAPEQLEPAIAIYRERFRPSQHLAKPHVMLGISVFAAQSDVEARRLFTSQQQAVINLRSGRAGPLPPPIDDIDAILDGRGQLILESVLACAVVGSPETVREGLSDFVARHRPDEVIVTAQIFDHAARLRSFEVLSGVWQ